MDDATDTAKDVVSIILIVQLVVVGNRRNSWGHGVRSRDFGGGSTGTGDVEVVGVTGEILWIGVQDRVVIITFI